jgi:hypothetical protein
MSNKLKYAGRIIGRMSPGQIRYRRYLMRLQMKGRRMDVCRKTGRRMLLKRLDLRVTPKSMGRIQRSKPLMLKLYGATHGWGFWPYDKIRRVKGHIKSLQPMPSREVQLYHWRMRIKFAREERDLPF